MFVIAGLAWQAAQLAAAAEVVVNRIKRKGVPTRVIIGRVGRDWGADDVPRMHNNDDHPAVRTREAVAGGQEHEDECHSESPSGGEVEYG
jgi:hypothetical protein